MNKRSEDICNLWADAVEGRLKSIVDELSRTDEAYLGPGNFKYPEPRVPTEAERVASELEQLKARIEDAIAVLKGEAFICEHEDDEY